MSAAFSVCVYCGSRPGSSTAFTQAARDTGQWVAQHGGRVVYGGGHNGLMGTVADAALEAGGEVLGIIPRSLVEREFAHTGVTELVVVDTMHERKKIMAENADAFLALPGGIGTFEELFEVWTWRQLGYHDKPIGLLNVDGYYDNLLSFLQTSVNHGFMNTSQMGLISLGTEARHLLPQLVQAAGLPTATRLDRI